MNAFRSRAVVAVAATLVVAVLGGCGTVVRHHEGADASVPSASSASAVAAPTTVPSPVHGAETTESPSGAADATGPSSPAPPGPGCREGHCTVTVIPGEVLAMDVAKFGFGRLTATGISADAVTVEATGPGISLSSTTPAGHSSLLNHLDILVRSVTGHSAVLVLSVH
ncbi:hypothetical protein [Streptomyces mexicanus]|uniref:Lipoprotein n=1 Tax=Streptomyces mexicanus TaxID=178566 RepID=A0A7X1LT40_9ACTN|nr:hypothetical protein [Streptomyces mexicanus]MBC2867026.1 hypothetical protein [Streptomyces mexicanus]